MAVWLKWLLQVPAWVIAICAVIIVVSVIWFGYEVGWKEKDGIFLRPAREDNLAMTFSDTTFQQLVSRELNASKAYYQTHSVTYQVLSLDASSRAVLLELTASGDIRNPGSVAYDKPLQVEWEKPSLRKPVKAPWAKVDGKSISARTIEHGAGLLIADFGTVSIPPGQSRYIERGFQMYTHLPYRGPDMLREPALSRSLTITVAEPLAGAVGLNVRPLFDRSFFDGPAKMSRVGFWELTWTANRTALFPYQGFFVEIEKK